jgi:4-methyl-5(b-hydroxyethyl)-thiazole monophosphate biosynthesis
MAKVLVPLANGFEEIEAVTIIDILRRGGVEVTTASLNLDEEVQGSNGITILANTLINYVTADEFDMIVLPGGIPGAEHLRDDTRIQELLKEFDGMGKKVGAICAAPIALYSAGVLKDEYTCYPGYEQVIKNSDFKEQKVVKSKNILTSRGPGTAMCFALEIVKQLVGDETYEQLKAGLLAEFC